VIARRSAGRTLPNYVGGETFRSITAYANAVKGSPGILVPGDTLRIYIGSVPSLEQPSEHSPFTATLGEDGYLVITAKANARLGRNESIWISRPGLTADDPVRTRFSLQLGTGRLMF
jgi:hypothetical protein